MSPGRVSAQLPPPQTHVRSAVIGPEDTRGSGTPPRLLTVVADLFHFFRSEPGNDRGPRGRIQGVELVMDVLHRQIGFLVLLT